MSLLRTAGRVAVASSVHGNVQRRQQQKFAAQDQKAAAQAAQQVQPQQVFVPVQQIPAPAAPSVDPAQRIQLLKELADLRAAGVLSDAEFEAQKAVILAS